MASQVVGQIADPGSVSSMAYKMGVLFASMSSPFFNEGNQLPEDSSGESEGGCQAKLSEQLRQKITGLIEYSQNLLEQIFSKKSDARTSICRWLFLFIVRIY